MPLSSKKVLDDAGWWKPKNKEHEEWKQEIQLRFIDFSYKTLEFMSTCSKFTRYTRVIQRKTVMFMNTSNYDLEHLSS